MTSPMLVVPNEKAAKAWNLTDSKILYSLYQACGCSIIMTLFDLEWFRIGSTWMITLYRHQFVHSLSLVMLGCLESAGYWDGFWSHVSPELCHHIVQSWRVGRGRRLFFTFALAVVSWDFDPSASTVFVCVQYIVNIRTYMNYNMWRTYTVHKYTCFMHHAFIIMCRPYHGFQLIMKPRHIQILHTIIWDLE